MVLYFYPRASSPGCSVEARAFETALPEFERRGATVIGVSTDTEAKQALFRDRCGLSFPLLPDGDKVIARAYGAVGVVGGLLNMASRRTFLIDPGGRVAHVYRVLNVGGHATEVLADLDRLRAEQPARASLS